MSNETEEREIEGVDSETEVMDSDNEGVDNKVLPPDQKGCSLSNPLNFNYSGKIATRRSIRRKNLIVVSNEIHSDAKYDANVLKFYCYCIKTKSTNQHHHHGDHTDAIQHQSGTQGIWQEGRG